MRLGEGKKFIESDWRRRVAYGLFGEPHVPGWIRLQHAIREVERLPLPRTARILDAGCSRGDFSLYMAERHPSWSFVGIEISQDRVEQAESIRCRIGLNNVQYRSGDLASLEWNDEFDAAVCLDVLEHIDDDVQAMRGLGRAVKPGGFVLVTSPSVPQPKHLWTVRWRERRAGFTPDEIGHVRDGYSEAELRELFEKCGLETEMIRYTYGRWGTLAFDLFFSAGDSKPNPLVFAAMYPALKTLARLDVHDQPEHGAAILGIGRKAVR